MARLGRAQSFRPIILTQPRGAIGDLSVTLGAVTLASAGVVAIAGSTSVTLGAVTLVSAGAVAIAGALAVTLGAVLLSAQGGALVIVTRIGNSLMLAMHRMMGR